MENSLITIWIDYNTTGFGEFHVTYHSKSTPLFSDIEDNPSSD